MSDVLVTTTDIGKFLAPEYADMYITAQNFAPELDLLAKVSSNSKTYVRPYVTLGASPAFRSVNAGVEYTSGTVANESVALKILTEFSAVDSASMSPKDLEKNKQIQLQAGFQRFRQSLGSQIIYGTAIGDSDGFSGINDLITSAYTIEAHGDTTNATTSAYLINVDPITGVQLVFQKMINVTGWYNATVVQSDKRFRGLENVIEAVVGLSLGVAGNVVKIDNIDADNKLTDALVAQALTLMPDEMVASGNLVLLANASAIAGLQSSRTATTVTGMSVPMPVESSGVPIIRTGSIVNTEAGSSSSSSTSTSTSSSSTSTSTSSSSTSTSSSSSTSASSTSISSSSSSASA